METTLEQIVMADGVWSHVTHEMLAEGYDVRQQAEYYGGRIADQVVKNALGVNDLRQCVRWANGLDRQAVESVGSDLEQLQGSDFHEALARRLMHGSTRMALERVKSHRRLQDHKINYFRRLRLLEADDTRGLFQLEARDLGLNSFADLRGHGKLSERKLQ